MRDGPFSFQSSWESFLPPNAVIMARRSDEVSAVAETAPRLVFETPGIEDPVHRELFDKIIAALGAGTKPEVESLIRFTASEGDSSKLGVWEMSVNSSGVSMPTLTTYSLASMVKNPGLKKAVWQHLKEALKVKA